MNRALSLLAGLLLIALSGCVVSGQDDKRQRDVTYSTHNYKHPNKAAQARRWEQAPGVVVQPRDARRVAQDNYKQRPAGPAPSGGITVPYQPSATLADRHYKTRNWLQKKPKPDGGTKPTYGDIPAGN